MGGGAVGVGEGDKRIYTVKKQEMTSESYRNADS